MNTTASTTHNMEWSLKGFDILTKLELHEILGLRQEVFVLEQTCIYRDADEWDKFALHLCGYVGDSEQPELAAYARIIPPGVKTNSASFGRLLVRKDYRGNGFGKALVARCVSQCQEAYPAADIGISAQVHLGKFYERFGFKTHSNPYDDAGIMHIDMILSS